MTEVSTSYEAVVAMAKCVYLLSRRHASLPHLGVMGDGDICMEWASMCARVVLYVDGETGELQVVYIRANGETMPDARYEMFDDELDAVTFACEKLKVLGLWGE